MNIGLIIHSKTGTTLKFGQMIAENLKESGHTVDIIELKTDIPLNTGSVRQAKKFSVLNVPNCEKFDALIVGGPVWAFSASPVLMKCLEGLQNISGKKLLPFVTMSFPFAFMGGLQAIALIKRTATKSGATVLPGKIIPKLFRNYNLHMEEAAFLIPAYFKDLK